MSLYALPFPAIDPVLVSFGPIAIRWYALAYIIGILLGWLYARAIIRREQLWASPVPMTVSDYDDFVLWVTLGIILGGRIGYVLFYNPSYFATHPLESFQLWKGGMSFHGGFLGYALARSVCEQFREPDPQLGFLWGGLTMGTLLSVPLMLAGIALMAAALRKGAVRRT